MELLKVVVLMLTMHILFLFFYYSFVFLHKVSLEILDFLRFVCF